MEVQTVLLRVSVVIWAKALEILLNAIEIHYKTNHWMKSDDVPMHAKARLEGISF